MAKNPLRKIPAQFQDNIETLVAEWQKSLETAAEAKNAEAAKRTALYDAIFAGSPEGTNHAPLPNGDSLVCDIRINRTVNRAELEAARAYALNKNNAQLLGLLDRVVSYDPKVVVGEYKSASNEEKKILADIIVEKPGLPGLEVKTPKK